MYLWYLWKISIFAVFPVTQNLIDFWPLLKTADPYCHIGDFCRLPAQHAFGTTYGQNQLVRFCLCTWRELWDQPVSPVRVYWPEAQYAF